MRKAWKKFVVNQKKVSAIEKIVIKWSLKSARSAKSFAFNSWKSFSDERTFSKIVSHFTMNPVFIGLISSDNCLSVFKTSTNQHIGAEIECGDSICVINSNNHGIVTLSEKGLIQIYQVTST